MEKGVASFRNLEVYKKAYSASINIHKMSLTFPKYEQYALADQIRRTSKSICANVAEGFAKQRSSKIEFKRFLLIAIGSASETLVWIDYCKDMAYIDEKTYENWREEYEGINRMLNAFYSRI
jgi:four helix bundle protein